MHSRSLLRQRQQDAGEFLQLLLDQFSLDTLSDGSVALRRASTAPRTEEGTDRDLLAKAAEAYEKEISAALTLGT